MSKFPPMSLTQVFKFGTHKRKTVEDVILESPSYIRWAIDDDVIELDNEAFAFFQEHEFDLPTFR